MNSEKNKNYIMIVSIMLNILILSLFLLNHQKNNDVIFDLEEQNEELVLEQNETKENYHELLDKIAVSKDEERMKSAREEAIFYIKQLENNK